MFTLNGKSYKLPEIDFNAVCELESKGVDLANIQKSQLIAIREIIALAFGGNSQIAGLEIQGHIESGGSFEEIANVVVQSIENSGFFQALNKRAK